MFYNSHTDNIPYNIPRLVILFWTKIVYRIIHAYMKGFTAIYNSWNNKYNALLDNGIGDLHILYEYESILYCI